MLRHKDDNELENIYIGSTTNFKVRKCCHKSACNNFNHKEYNQKKYQYIRENGGWENWIMKPIEDYPCNTLRELEAREDAIMIQYVNRLNEKRASRSVKEWCQDNAEKIKEVRKKYYEDNAEKIKERLKKYYEENLDKCKAIKKKYREENLEKAKERHKKYYEENLEKVKEQRKERNKKYRENNAEKIKAIKKKYRENNKEKLKEQITCECGCIFRRDSLTRHLKTQKHLDLINQPVSFA